MTYSCCFSSGGNLDFPEFLKKQTARADRINKIFSLNFRFACLERSKQAKKNFAQENFFTELGPG